VWVRSVTRRRQRTLVLLSNQNALKEVEPFLHGSDLFTKLPNCRIRKSSIGRATFNALSEGARKSNNDHADRDGRNDRDDGDSWVHPFASCLNDLWCCCLTARA